MRDARARLKTIEVLCPIDRAQQKCSAHCATVRKKSQQNPLKPIDFDGLLATNHQVSELRAQWHPGLYCGNKREHFKDSFLASKLVQREVKTLLAQATEPNYWQMILLWGIRFEWLLNERGSREVVFFMTQAILKRFSVQGNNRYFFREVYNE